MTEPKPSRSRRRLRRDFLKASTVAAAGGSALTGLGLVLERARGRQRHDQGRPDRLRRPGHRRGRAVGHLRPERQARRHGRRVPGPRRRLPEQPQEARRQDRRPRRPLLRRLRRLQEGDRQRRRPRDPGHAAGLPPEHLAAAIAAGKHVFTEKPVAVDGPGIRKVLAAAEEAKKKKLAVVAGTQRRHQASYLESMKRIHDGEIGEITSARCYWNQGSLWMKPRESAWTDMEWQLRNWLYFTWLSGDHICEQHVHNLDVVNWAIGGPPGPRRRHGRASGPHRPRVRQHLRPLRGRLRVPQRRPRR